MVFWFLLQKSFNLIIMNNIFCNSMATILKKSISNCQNLMISMSSCTKLIYDLKSLLDILLLTFPEKLGSTQVFGGFHVFHLFSFLCCVVLCFCVLFVFVLCLVCQMLPMSLDCLRPVSCLSNVANVSGLSSSCVLPVKCCQCL